MQSEEKARRVIQFIECLRHTKGEFHGQPFKLLPWQERIIRDVFGTVREEDPTIRQYTTAYIEIPKKQGKSELGAAIALNMLCNDDEWRAEVYSCASDRQQAAIVFDVAVDMVKQSPALSKRIYASMAQSESCSHSENVRWARKRRDEVGDPIRVAPYGYRRVRPAGQKKNQWIINEPEAKRVRLIFTMAYQGYSTLEIREALNRLEETEQTGYKWKKDRLPFILKHEVYRGDLLTSKWISMDYLHPKAIRNRGQAEQFYIEQHHEAIVDPEVFDTVQEYFQNGFLNGRMFRRREAWFNEHPEILKRREQNNV